MNQYEQRCNEAPAFKVHGHDVVLMSPYMAKITIQCPWPAPHVGQAPTESQITFVKTQTQSVVNYLLAEQFMVNGGAGVGIMVETNHQKA